MTKQEIVSLRVRRAVTKDVGLAGVMLYVPIVVVETGPSAAWTDGTKMFFGSSFFDLADAEQVGVCIHECLHVVLRHVQRGRGLYQREGSAYRHDLWNAACDAVINNSIGQISWASLPDDVIRIDKLLGPDLLKEKPAQLWTSEQIYDELKNRSPQSPLHSFTLSGDLDQNGQVAQGARLAGDSHEQEMEARIWRERIVRAQAGSLPGGLLRKIASDVPESKIPWEIVLREFLKSHCMPTTESTWNRPSRRTLSLGHEARYVEAGTDRKRGLVRIGIVLDTSGSIDDQVLVTFIGEINAIIHASGAEAVVVDCDAAVHRVSVFRKTIANYTPIGGGGTDFRPGVAELERRGVTVGVYLTDLCGTFPERRPRFPLLWAATAELPVPFGRRVLIPKK